MISSIFAYQSLLDQILVFALLAMSQAIVLRAGLFSLGSAAFAGLSAYATAILTTMYGVTPVIAIACGVAFATLLSAVMAIAMSRLRGVFQAVATIALVQIVVTLALGWESVTRGALGINGIPKVATTGWLLLVVLAVTAFLHTLARFRIGRTFDVIREDETVAVSLGISVSYHHGIAMTLSGALAGLAGALYACNSNAIYPQEFGFGMLVNVLAMTVLGGTKSVGGALLGAAILTSLPELFRAFADYRNIMQGIVLMLVIVFLPNGIVDTLVARAHDWRMNRATVAWRIRGDKKAPTQ